MLSEITKLLAKTDTLSRTGPRSAGRFGGAMTGRTPMASTSGR